MRFKLEYTIRCFSLPKDETLLFEVKDAHSVHVELRAPNKDEQEIGHKTQHAFCIAHVERNVSEKNQKIFERIENNKIIENELEWCQKYKGQNDKEIILPSINDFPDYFKSYLSQVNQELSNSSKLVVNAIRWRTNTLGPHNAISTSGLSWSRDKKYWHPVPSSFSLRVFYASSIVRVSKETLLDVNNIIKNRLQEPIHHELFREAWWQRNDNPRSSLVTGLSALEVAIKTTIGNLIPDTSWLVENLPSPHVARLLNEYVPKLPAVNKIDGKVLPPPKQIVELIKKAVTIRN